MNTIVYICDYKYAIPAAVSIRSVLKNKTKDIEIIVLAIDLDIDTVRYIENIDQCIHVMNLDRNMFFNSEDVKHSYVSTCALFKFYIPEILSDKSKVMYIDGDTILKPGFDSIFDIDIDDYYAAVVRDMLCEKEEKWAEILGLDHYFNSGMMLLNLDRLRKEKMSDKLLEYRLNDPDRNFMDQNALNVLFNNNVLWLSLFYNYLTAYLPVYTHSQIAEYFGIDENDYMEQYAKCYIIHYAGKIKIWNDPENSEYQRWAEYALPSDLEIIQRLKK